MNGLLSTASPWQNDSVTNSTNASSKKRTPSLGIPRNKTIKKNVKSQVHVLDDMYEFDNEDTDMSFNEKESFQTDITASNMYPNIKKSTQNTIETIQQDNQTRMSKVQQLINNMNMENDGQDLANFKPIDYVSSNSDVSPNTEKNIPIKPLYSMNEQPSIMSNPYSSYRDIYSGNSNLGNASYYKNAGKKGDGEPQTEKIMEKLNRMLHLLEEQQFEPTKHITEEFILYTFLGVFVIYIVDSFTRAGKYIR